MSYAEYMRRKAAAAPKIIDTTVRSDASTITMRRRLQANREFFISARQGVINNVSDPSNTGTSNRIKAPTVTTKDSGGKVPDASMFTAFVGGDAINADGGIFQVARRLVANSNTAGSISACVTIPDPVPYYPQGTLITTVTPTITSLTASGSALTVGFTSYTIPGNVATVSPAVGRNVTISGAISALSLTGFTAAAGNVTATTASTAGIQNGTVIVVSGGTASAGNLGTFTVTSFVANTSITYANASGVTEVRTAIARFTSPNNGTYPIASVVSPTQIVVTNPNAITDSGANVSFGTLSLPLYATGAYGSNAVQQNASNRAITLKSCIQPSTEPHIQNELGPSEFVGDTIALNRSIGITRTNQTATAPDGTLVYLGVNVVDNVPAAPAVCPPVNHTHPANVPHNQYQARPVKGRGGIPVFTIASADDARKVGSYNFNRDHHKYVESHHGNDLNVNPRQLIKKYQIPKGPAHLKINDPNHYPVA